MGKKKNDKCVWKHIEKAFYVTEQHYKTEQRYEKNETKSQKSQEKRFTF